MESWDFWEPEEEFAGAAVGAVRGIEAALEEFEVDVRMWWALPMGNSGSGIQDLHIWNSTRTVAM